MPSAKAATGRARIRRVSRSCGSHLRAQTLGQLWCAGVLHGAAGLRTLPRRGVSRLAANERLTVRVIYDTSMPKRCMLKSPLMRRVAF